MKYIDQDILWKGKFLEMREITYTDREGVRRKWEAVGRVNSHGVSVVLPLTTDNELILIRQYRPALDAYVIEPPAGLVDEGEEPIDAAGRELIEETGYRSDRIIPLTEGVMSTGIDCEKWSVFFALDAQKVPQESMVHHQGDENEDIEVVTLACDDVFDFLQEEIRKGNKVDLRIFGLWELARRKLEQISEEMPDPSVRP